MGLVHVLGYWLFSLCLHGKRDDMVANKNYPRMVYYCMLEDRTLREEDTVKCIVRNCKYLILDKLEAIEYLKAVYHGKKNIS